VDSIQSLPLRDDERVSTRKIGWKRIINAHCHNGITTCGSCLNQQIMSIQMSRSARCLWSPGVLRHPPINAFDHIAKPRR
jgi:hypothetical protein